jgi:hypothetical protein
VSTGPDEFRTAVLDCSGYWPDPPRMWSYSSLREAEECPRRWMLTRADYPGIWSRPGYPPRPAGQELLGQVVHRMLEVILRGLQARRCVSTADASAVAVLKDLGGYSRLAERAIQEQMTRLADNPRTSDRTAALQAALRAKIPEIRQRAQEILSRTALQPAQAPDGAGQPAERAQLTHGSHPEVELRAPALRFAGRVDLITITSEGCEITDYKTGAPSTNHEDQLRTYALLWSRDKERNPSALPVRRLTLAYPSTVTEVDPPTCDGLDELASQIAARTGAAETALQERPPPARPSAPMCRLCGVRQLCDDYWSSLDRLTDSQPEPGEPDWFDYEGIVISRNGPRSWLLTANPGDKPDLLLRVTYEAGGFHSGDRLRILNLLRDRDPELPFLVGAMTGTSEIFVLEPSG